MKVSIIVAVYNVQDYLRKCLDSLVNQSFEDKYELIIVNDGSIDDSQKIVDEYKQKYKDKIKAYEKKNGGVATVRNFGLEKATGEYITFIDGDDYVSNDFIRNMYEKIVDDKADIVICDFYKAYEDHLEEIKALPQDELLLSNPSVWNKLYKKSLFTANGILFTDGINYAEDLEVFTKLCLYIKKHSYVEKPLIYYVQRVGSITNQQSFNKNKLDVFKVFDSIIKYYKDRMKYSAYRDLLEYLAIVNLMHALFILVYKYDEAQLVVDKINNYMKTNFVNWSKNEYFKKDNWRFKLVCYLISKKQIKLLRLILK